MPASSIKREINYEQFIPVRCILDSELLHRVKHSPLAAHELHPEILAEGLGGLVAGLGCGREAAGEDYPLAGEIDAGGIACGGMRDGAASSPMGHVAALELGILTELL